VKAIAGTSFFTYTYDWIFEVILNGVEYKYSGQYEPNVEYEYIVADPGFTKRVSRSIYEGPVFFRGVDPGYCITDLVISIADDFYDVSVDPATIAWERSFANYQPPGYC
jgi:hypothetical protein